MKDDLITTIIAFIAVFILSFGCGTGWIMNILKLTKCDFEPVGKEEFVRGIGIVVAPVGMVCGWIDMED